MHTLVTSAVASGHWYTNGTVLGIAGVVAGVLAIVVTIFLWRMGAPRGLLEYSMPTAEAIVGRRPQLSGEDLRVMVRGNVAENPYLVVVHLENNGHRDIRAEDFDQKTSLVLKLGVPILALLSYSGTNDHAFSVKEKAGEINLRPGLIRRGQRITLNVLAEGQPTLSCDESLADVKVRLQSVDTPMWVNHGAISSVILILIGTILLGPNRANGASVAAGIPLVSIGLLTYLLVWLIRLRNSHFRWRGRKYV